MATNTARASKLAEQARYEADREHNRKNALPCRTFTPDEVRAWAAARGLRSAFDGQDSRQPARARRSRVEALKAAAERASL